MTTVPDPAITASPDRLGGAPVFAGTRVPARSLIDFLEAGHPLDQFLDEFPSVSREHAHRSIGNRKASADDSRGLAAATSD